MNKENTNSIQELGILKYGVKKIIDYVTRKKWLYKTVGYGALVTLITELISMSLPEELLPNYGEIVIEHGYLAAMGIALFIGKYFNEIEFTPVIIKFSLVLVCLWIDYKVQVKDGNKKTFWNFFMGVNQTFHQDFTTKDED